MASNHDKEKFNKYGQFMTQKKLVNFVLNEINEINEIGGNILEPSFGDGNFINAIRNNYRYDKIDAYEIDSNMFNLVNIDNDNINLYLDDFILSTNEFTYNHIIGNPPYVEINYSYYDEKTIISLKKRYKSISDGRLNLVHMFVIRSYELLEGGGYLSFLLPSVILTSPYYKKLRKFIYDKFNIECVKNDVIFDGVTIKVSLLILKKTSIKDNKFFVNYDKNYYITEKYQIYPTTEQTLKDIGFKVNIGNICWNHHKDILTDDNSFTPIIYAKNIVNNSIDLNVNLSNNDQKKQYIKNNEIRYKNFIVIPRTIGNNIKLSFIKNNDIYQIENHLLVITHDDISMLERLYDSFINKKVDKYIKLFNTSSTISSKEILSIPTDIIS